MNQSFKIMTKKSGLALVAAIVVFGIASPAFARPATHALAHKSQYHKQQVALRGLQNRVYGERYADNLDYEIIAHGYPWAFR